MLRKSQSFLLTSHEKDEDDDAAHVDELEVAVELELVDVLQPFSSRRLEGGLRLLDNDLVDDLDDLDELADDQCSSSYSSQEEGFDYSTMSGEGPEGSAWNATTAAKRDRVRATAQRQQMAPWMKMS